MKVSGKTTKSLVGVNSSTPMVIPMKVNGNSMKLMGLEFIFMTGPNMKVISKMISNMAKVQKIGQMVMFIMGCIKKE